jgi:hypothetical protein
MLDQLLPLVRGHLLVDNGQRRCSSRSDAWSKLGLNISGKSEEHNSQSHDEQRREKEQQAVARKPACTCMTEAGSDDG